VDVLDDNMEHDLFGELHVGILGDNYCQNYTIDKFNGHITSNWKDMSVMHLNTRFCLPLSYVNIDDHAVGIECAHVPTFNMLNCTKHR
jgi:hypothetical protein